MHTKRHQVLWLIFRGLLLGQFVSYLSQTFIFNHLQVLNFCHFGSLTFLNALPLILGQKTTVKI